MLAVEEAMIEENKRIFARGEKKGIKRGKLETAKNLLKDGITIETIAKATGLSKEEILKNI